MGADHEDRARQRQAGLVVAVNVSAGKGTRKQNIGCCVLEVEHGLAGDAHAGPHHRQVSLLAEESIDRMRASGMSLAPGDFAENITTRGLDLARLPIGTLLRLDEVELEVTQIGKECHRGCEIRALVGDCVMPREGIFARVQQGGMVEVGQPIEVLVGRAAVVTVSDGCSAGRRIDESGPHLARLLHQGRWAVLDPEVVPDEQERIAEVLRRLADEERADVILTTGGTGFSRRDVTPEATLAVVERRAPGLAEAVRAEGMKKTPNACLSRAEAGLRGRTLIINLPGSLKAVREGMDFLLPILPHALAMMRGGGHD